MRNLGTRFNESNVISVYGSSDEELKQALAVLHKALDAVPEGLTPSEERVVNGFVNWYKGIDVNRPYKSQHPAYAYVNLNTGVNLLFLVHGMYEGVGGSLEPSFFQTNHHLHAEQFD